MKKKVFIILAAGAFIITTFKTGYAYYESQTKALAKQNLTASVEYESNKEPEAANAISEEVTEDESSGIYNLTKKDNSEVYTEDNYGEEEFIGGCCGSGDYSMLDENGNLKTPEVYEQELDEGIKSGELTKEDKEYFLDIYNECYEFYFNNSKELKENEF